MMTANADMLMLMLMLIRMLMLILIRMQQGGARRAAPCCLPRCRGGAGRGGAGRGGAGQGRTDAEHPLAQVRGPRELRATSWAACELRVPDGQHTMGRWRECWADTELREMYARLMTGAG